MADVFISHSSLDKAIADHLCNELEAKGLKCWIAPRDIVPGSDWAAAISNAINSTKVMLLIYSHNSAQSTQVPKEVNIAEKKGKFIIPYKIDDAELMGAFDYFLTGAHWIVANPAMDDYKVDELYGVITGVMQVAPQSVTNNTYIDNLTINNPTPVTQANATNVAATATASTSATPTQSATRPVNPTPVVPANTTATPAAGQPQKNNKLMIGILCGIGALIVILLIVLIVVLGGKNESEKDKETSKQTESQEVVKDDDDEPEITAAPEVTEEPVVTEAPVEEAYTPIENFEYTDEYMDSYGGMMITKYIGTVEDVVIPPEIDGVPVTALGVDAFRECESLKTVVIPEGVTIIGRCAFYKCTNLTQVDIPDSVTLINDWAFSHTALTEVEIPVGVTKISARTFNSCEKLTSVTIPEGVMVIEDSAFYRCSALKNITLPSTLEKIDVWTFAATGLTEVVIPAKVQSIGNYAFNDCVGLSSAAIPESVKAVGEFAFAHTSLVEVEVPNVEYLGHAVFYQCASLEKISISGSLTRIPSYAFADCTNLTQISMPKKITVIDEWAFTNTGFTSLNASEFMFTHIGAGAFANCVNAETIVLPGTVVSVSNGAFQGCEKLTNLTLPDGIKEVDGNIVAGSLNAVITYQGNNYTHDKLGDIVNLLRPVSEKNFEYTVADGTATITKYIGTDTDVAIPAFIGGVLVTKIGEEAFADNPNIISVSVPGGVTVIDVNAFINCTSLKDVVLPGNVKEFGYGAFRETAISSIRIPSGQIAVGYCMFYGCDNLKYVTIPDTVTYIGKFAFSKCVSLEELELSDDTEEIISNAFDDSKKITISFQEKKYSYDNRGNIPGTVEAAE